MRIKPMFHTSLIMVALGLLLSSCGGGDGDSGYQGWGNRNPYPYDENAWRNNHTSPPPGSNAVQFDSGVTYEVELYVSTTGSDTGNDGQSPGRAFASLDHATRIAMNQNPQQATRINVAPGIYGRQRGLSLNRDISTPLAIVGSGPGVRIRHTGSPSNGLYISRARYVVIENLEIEGNANGLSIDDGGDVEIANVTSHIIIRNSHITARRDPSSGRNLDALKLSGVNNFLVLDNIIETAGPSGSGIDAVGCHDGVISSNLIRGLYNLSDLNLQSDIGGSGIQAKGGSANILIHGNTIRDLNPLGGRAINAGGGTGELFYRPPIIRGIENIEAQEINTVSNVIINTFDAIAFVNCVNCSFGNNTVIDIGSGHEPGRFGHAVRILDENADQDFEIALTRNGRVYNNIFYYSTDNTAQNIMTGDSSTLQGSFDIQNNLWWAYNESSSHRPAFSSALLSETGAMYQLNPLFVDPDNSQFMLRNNTPVRGRGNSTLSHDLDMDWNTFNTHPAVGAYEAPAP